MNETNGKSTVVKNGRRAGPALVESSAAQAAELSQEALAPDDEGLSRLEIRGLLKPRDGFGPFVARILDLYTGQPAELGTSIDVKQHKADYAEWKAMAGSEAQAEAAVAQATARLLHIKGDRSAKIAGVWSAMLEIYGKANGSRKLKSHPTITSFRKLMAHKKPKKAPPPAK